MRRLLLLLAAVAAALGATVSGDARPSAVSGEIAYMARGDIYVVNADGTGRHRVLSGSAVDTFNWSPDGRLIAYTAGPWGQPEDLLPTVIRIARADGTVVRTMPRGGLSSALEPAWSPDGTQLVFAGYEKRDDRLSIYLIKTDGTSLRRLTHVPTWAWEENPHWSADGRWIVFERYGDDASWTDVVAIRPDGTGTRGIARIYQPPENLYPRWSPNGARIAYQGPAFTEQGWTRIFVMNADGTGKTQLTSTDKRVDDEDPDWSPDGKWIAFDSTRQGRAEIYVVGADGGHLRRVTRDPTSVMHPRWRPTG